VNIDHTQNYLHSFTSCSYFNLQTETPISQHYNKILVQQPPPKLKIQYIQSIPCKLKETFLQPKHTLDEDLCTSSGKELFGQFTLSICEHYEHCINLTHKTPTMQQITHMYNLPPIS
jgi:hypothetical protein